MKNIFKVIKLAKPMHFLMLIIMLIVIIGGIFEIVTPLLSGRIVDEVVKIAGVENKDYSMLISLLSFSIGSTALGLVFRSVGQRLGDELAARVRKHLTEIFYDKALRLSQSYYDSALSGKVINQLNRGIFTIQQFINTSTNFIIPIFLQTFIVLGILMYYNFYLGLLMLSILPIYMYITSISTKKWGEKEEAKNKIEDATRGRISEVITNIKLVKGFTSEKLEFDFTSENLKNINSIFSKQSTQFHLYDFSREFVLAIILFGTSLIIYNSTLQGLISVGMVIVLIQLVDRARNSLFGMSYILSQIQVVESGSKEFFEILELESTEDYKQNKTIEIVNDPKIEFKDVDFGYTSDELVVKKLNFTVTKNEMVALVGPSGSGKSTIVNLLLKLYSPTSGEIMLNGNKYSELTHFDIRQNIALVFQENELFSTSIKENVIYGSKFDKKKLEDALKKANAWDFVSKLENGYDTEVGERGVKLSGGQRQRIQVARAIYKDATILVLDEATSSLDAKSENEVSEAIDNLVKDRLVIVIAHRFSTIQNATKIIVLNDKKIESIGTPQDLAGKPGIYSDLLKYQIDGNKKLLKKFELY